MQTNPRDRQSAPAASSVRARALSAFMPPSIKSSADMRKVKTLVIPIAIRTASVTATEKRKWRVKSPPQSSSRWLVQAARNWLIK